MSKMYHVPEHARDNYKGYHGMYPENYGNSEICRDEINEKLVSKAKKNIIIKAILVIRLVFTMKTILL